MDDKVFRLLEQMYSDLSSKMDKMDTQIQNGLKDAKQEVKQDIARLENKMDTHLKALYDGYKQNTEKLSEVELKVDNLINKVEGQAVEIRVIKGAK